MKKLISFIVMVLFVSFLSFGEVFKAPTKQNVAFTDTTTTHTFEIKDKQYPIFKTKSGRYYIWKTSSKTGKQYRYYLPKEIQEQIKQTNK